MDLKDIKAIIDLMKKNSVSEFELERQDFKIRLKRGGVQIAQYEDAPVGVSMGGVAQLPAMLPVSTVSAPPATPPVSKDAEIKSPMIGTVYRAPSP